MYTVQGLFLQPFSACRMFNGGRASLVSIHSKEENKFIWDNAVDKMNGKMHVWIGMKKTALGKIVSASARPVNLHKEEVYKKCLL